jgi:hypothetical protein
MTDPVDLPVYANPIDTAPGFFRMRWAKGTCWVPAKLWRVEERDEVGDLMADVQYFASIDQDEVPAHDPPRWPWTRIEEPEYRHLVDLFAWSRSYAPDSAEANPKRPISQATIDFV